jgi:mannose/fructose/N-acetylgalactosamine-specific phosphotransferase system component IIC
MRGWLLRVICRLSIGVALERLFFQSFPFMKNQKLASDDAYSSANPAESRSFNMLSRILVALMCAAVLFFALLLVPVEFDSVMEELLGWCVIGLAAVLAFIVVMGLIEQIAD